MPSAAGITISYEGKRRFDAEETCQYCSIQNCCNDSDSMQSSKFPTNNGPVSLRIATNHAHHTCTTPVTELPGHRGSDRIRFLYPGCCSNVENTNHQQPQITTRGRSTQRQRVATSCDDPAKVFTVVFRSRSNLGKAGEAQAGHCYALINDE